MRTERLCGCRCTMRQGRAGGGMHTLWCRTHEWGSRRWLKCPSVKSTLSAYTETPQVSRKHSKYPHKSHIDARMHVVEQRWREGDCVNMCMLIVRAHMQHPFYWVSRPAPSPSPHADTNTQDTRRAWWRPLMCKRLHHAATSWFTWRVQALRCSRRP